jgi:hypothetical protein
MGLARTMLRVAKRVFISARLSLLRPAVDYILSLFLRGLSRYEPRPYACRRFTMALSASAIRAHNRKLESPVRG